MLRLNTAIVLVTFAALAATACGDDETASVGAGGSTTNATNGPTTTGNSTSTGTSTSVGGASTTATTGSGGGFACPTATLSGALPITYQGTTIGAPNLVESNRLEWVADGDNGLLFVAPATATYDVTFTTNTPNAGCGVSVREYGPAMNGQGDFYDSNSCGAPGTPADIDGVFVAGDGFSDPVGLNAGQEVMFFVSCQPFGMSTEADYTFVLSQL